MSNNSNHVKCRNEFTCCGRQFNGYTSPERLTEAMNFQFLPTDIVVNTFPKSGTTFVQEIVWQILNRHKVVKGEKPAGITERIPFLEIHLQGSETLFHLPNFVEVLNEQRSQPYRLIKTHLPYEMLKSSYELTRPKIIIVMRNAKDCLVSNYHFYLHIEHHEWQGEFSDFFPIFLDGKTYTGSYFDNNLEWWSLRERSNILIIFYEDLLKNLEKNLQKIAKFVENDTELDLTREELDKIAYNSSFKTMSENERTNFTTASGFQFLRKGQIGDWKNYFSEEQNRAMEERIEEKFGGTGLEFVYE